LGKVGVAPPQKMNLFEIVASVLHLGNITFEDADTGIVTTSKVETHIKTISSLLQIDQDALSKRLTERKIKVRDWP
jgi:myosin heavy subunit